MRQLFCIFILSLGMQNIAFAQQDWDENGATVGCVWAKDVPGTKFRPGKGFPSVTLNFYSDHLGKNLINTIKDDHHFYLAVAKKGSYVKLKLNEKVLGWVPENQLFFGALHNCN